MAWISTHLYKNVRLINCQQLNRDLYILRLCKLIEIKKYWSKDKWNSTGLHSYWSVVIKYQGTRSIAAPSQIILPQQFPMFLLAFTCVYFYCSVRRRTVRKTVHSQNTISKIKRANRSALACRDARTIRLHRFQSFILGKLN